MPISSNLVPSSMQRIRTFLNETCGMKVRPWAGTAETLAGLHAVLVRKSGCPIFWKSLQLLLERLAQDLKRREDAQPDQIVDNEILCSERYAALLDEIKGALAAEAPGRQTFAKLTAALSMQAAALLLLLAGVTSAGCATHPALSVSRSDSGASVAETQATDVPPSVADGPAVLPRPDSPTVSSQTDASAVFVLPDTAPDTGRDAGQSDAIVITLPRDAGPEIPLPSCDGACTLEDLMIACGIAPASRQSITACVERLKSSWREGLTAGLASRPCDNIIEISGESCLGALCQPGHVSTLEYYESILDCREPPLMPIYVGVRFA